jgi:hypothetical protein
MSRLDAQFAACRRLAFAKPLTRARPVPQPVLEIGGGIAVALSVNK